MNQKFFAAKVVWYDEGNALGVGNRTILRPERAKQMAD
jgi:hypothetical protein